MCFNIVNNPVVCVFVSDYVYNIWNIHDYRSSFFKHVYMINDVCFAKENVFFYVKYKMCCKIWFVVRLF